MRQFRCAATMLLILSLVLAADSNYSSVFAEELKIVKFNDYEKVTDVTSYFKKELILTGDSIEFGAKNDDLIYNIKKFRSQISGTLLHSGQEFSFNTIVGDANLVENGYKLANLRTEDKEAYNPKDSAYGIGREIVASSLYFAASTLKLEVLERHVYTTEPGIAGQFLHYDYGTEIVYGEKDLRFKNNLEYTILIIISVVEEGDPGISSCITYIVKFEQSDGTKK